MGEIYFDIAATIIICLNIFIFYYKKYLYTLQTKVFIYLLWDSLFAVLMDIITVLMNQHAQYLPLWSLYGANMLYYMFQNSIPILFASYVIILTDQHENMGWLIRGIFMLPWALVMGIILTNPWTKSLFYFDAQLIYTHGSHLSILYLFALFYVMMSVRYAFIYRRLLSLKISRAVYLFVAVSLLPFIVQFFYPQLLIQALGIAISELFILLTVQNPDEYIDSRTGLYSRNGFVHQYKLFQSTEESFPLLLVVMENLSFLQHNLGLQFFSRITRQVSLYMAKKIHEGLVAASLGEGRYVMMLRETPKGQPFPELVTELKDRFRLPWRVDENPIILSARFCQIQCPQDFEDVTDIFNCLDQMESLPGERRQDGILKLKDLGLVNKKREAQVELALRKALDHNGFQLYYQPIYSVSQGRFVSAEALLRLFDDELGFIPPDEFIPISERNGMIVELGAWVIDTACSFMNEHKLEEQGIEFLEINLSVVQCLRQDLSQRVMEISGKNHVPPERICLEITESTAASSPEALVRNFKTLSGNGYLFALDDYGTGYSNINYLVQLPFAYAKLDRGFVAARFESMRGRIVLESTIEMFKKMRLSIIAEGVETEEQARVLSELGCDFLQGYYFSRPVPGDAFLNLIRKG